MAGRLRKHAGRLLDVDLVRLHAQTDAARARLFEAAGYTPRRLRRAFPSTPRRRLTQQGKENAMAKIFISGSSTGLGLMTGRLLVEQGHQVVLHGRSAARSADARRSTAESPGGRHRRPLPPCEGCAQVAEQVNRLGRFDAVIHNAGIGYREPKRVETEDGVPRCSRPTCSHHSS